METTEAVVPPKKKKKQKVTENDELVEDELVDVVDGSAVEMTKLGEVISQKTVDSEVRSRRVLQALIAPIGARQFWKKYFEKKAFVIKHREAPELMSMAEVFETLEQGDMEVGKDVDVTLFDGEKRQNFGQGILTRADAEKFFHKKKCTIRLRCPQAKLEKVHELCESLEEEFGFDVSSNAYLTPAQSQGFAPHFDDVDVFVLQLHGSKTWIIDAPAENQELPRFSSEDFHEADLRGQFSRSKIELETGDLLYLPRGFIHQATSSEEPSLHLTISTHRLATWTDFLEEALRRGLDSASLKNRDFRTSLPRDYFHYMGLQHSTEDDDVAPEEEEEEEEEEDDGASIAEVAAASYDAELERGRRKQLERRTAFRDEVKRRLRTVVDAVVDSGALDDAADDMALRFLADRQPTKKPPQKKMVPPTALVRPVGRRIARLVMDDPPDKVLLYHSLDNAKTYRGTALACLDFDLDDAPALEAILHSHTARSLRVHDLPGGDLDEKINLCTSLHHHGILHAHVPMDDDDEDDDSEDD